MTRENSKCDFCEATIVPQGSGRAIAADPYERMKQTGHYCSDCNVVACCPCAHKAAMKVGASYFICPTCGESIHNHMV